MRFVDPESNATSMNGTASSAAMRTMPIGTRRELTSEVFLIAMNA